VHHNVVRGAVVDEENLRDAEDLDRQLGLGQPGAVSLLLHGHTHDGQLHRLPSGLVALSTGSAAVIAEARPREVPNQDQLVTIRPDGLTRHARQYALGQRCWIGDTRISRSGSDWHEDERHLLVDVGAAFGGGEPDPGDRPGIDRAAAIGADRKPADGYFDRVLEATRVAHPHATVTPRPDRGYLRSTATGPRGHQSRAHPGVSLAVILQRVAVQLGEHHACMDPRTGGLDPNHEPGQAASIKRGERPPR
jgi:hypothetical protein